MDIKSMLFSRVFLPYLLAYFSVRYFCSIFFRCQLRYNIYLHNLPYCMQINNDINIYESRPSVLELALNVCGRAQLMIN